MRHIVHTATALMLLCVLAVHARTSMPPAGGCDTLITVEGKIYLVSNIEEHWKEIYFSPCDDATRVHAMPKDRVASIKKAKIPVVPVLPKVKTPIDSASRMVNRTVGLGVIALCCTLTVVLYPVGFIMGLLAMHKATKRLRSLKKHPNYKTLRRELRLAMLLGGIASVGPIVLLLFLFVAASIIFSGFGGFDFDFSGSLFGTW